MLHCQCYGCTLQYEGSMRGVHAHMCCLHNTSWQITFW